MGKLVLTKTYAGISRGFQKDVELFGMANNRNPIVIVFQSQSESELNGSLTDMQVVWK